MKTESELKSMIATVKTVVGSHKADKVEFRRTCVNRKVLKDGSTKITSEKYTVLVRLPSKGWKAIAELTGGNFDGVLTMAEAKYIVYAAIGAPLADNALQEVRAAIKAACERIEKTERTILQNGVEALQKKATESAEKRYSKLVDKYASIDYMADNKSNAGESEADEGERYVA